MPEPMRPEDIRPELKQILDRAAGKDHSATGAVMTCLAEILSDYYTMVEGQVRQRLSADLLERAGRAPSASGFRRGLRTAANIVAPDPTLGEVAEALRSGDFAACDPPEDRIARGEA